MLSDASEAEQRVNKFIQKEIHGRVKYDHI